MGLLQILKTISVNFLQASTKALQGYVLHALTAYLVVLFYQQNNKNRMSCEPKQMEMIWM
jgi:hypothetical protein